jgi:hypothetical protein
VISGVAKIPGIKIQDTRMLRLMEVMLHEGTTVSGWSAARIHDAVLTMYAIAEERYRLPQLRSNLRKLKAPGLLERDGRHYAYRLTDKGIKVALMFVLFHKRVCGPIANSLFHSRTHAGHRPPSKLKATYDKVDASIQQLIDFFKAA